MVDFASSALFHTAAVLAPDHCTQSALSVNRTTMKRTHSNLRQFSSSNDRSERKGALKKQRYSASESTSSFVTEARDDLHSKCGCPHQEHSTLFDREVETDDGLRPSPETFSPGSGASARKSPAFLHEERHDELDGNDDQFVFDSFATGDVGPAGWTEETLVHVLTNDIEDLCTANENTVSGPEVEEELKIFFSQHKQPFDMEFYVRRLVQYSNCSASAFVAALVYLDRVHLKRRSLSMTEMNCHRLLSTALVLAIKYLDDEVYSNAYYARVGGLTTDELNKLETTMLEILDWNLTVSPQTYGRYEDTLLKSAATISACELPGSPASM